MPGAKRYVKGDRAFRKILRRLPDSMKQEMVEMLDEVGSELLTAMRVAVPVRTGALRAGLSKKVLKATMRLKVGLIGKGKASDLFYGRIVEFGRRAQTVRVVRTTTRSKSYHARRRRELGLTLRKPYSMRVKAMRPRPFVTTRRRELRASITKRINAFWDKTLAKASAGASDA